MLSSSAMQTTSRATFRRITTTDRMTHEPENADVFDFVDAYLTELESGHLHPLTHWLERFPRSQSAVAREWLRLTSPPSSARPLDETSAVPADTEPRLGPYRILHELGRGGQGTVFLAEDSRIARRVALKVLTTGFDTVSDEKRQRFRREADVIARLEHPGLCTIHDADLTSNTPWIAMRFVEGRTLADLIAEARTTHGDPVFGLRIPPRTALELNTILLLFERAARALHAAHEAGIVHRDIKPGNIVVAIDGKPVILDFGLARDDESHDDISRAGALTQPGDLFGTPAYMSPEQLSQASAALDRRTDIYSLGVALYETLTLARPFDHAVRTEMYRSILQDPVPDARRRNPTLPADIQVVLETALEKDRDRRYSTALDLAEDLRRIREYEPIRARPASTRVRFARWTKRHPTLAVATIGTILLLSVGLAVTLHLLAGEKRALRFAVGQKLAQRAEALAKEDPPVALALGIEAVERAPNDLTRASLFTALDECWLARAIEPPRDKLFVKSIATCTTSAVGAIGFSSGAVFLVDLASGDRLRTLDGHAAAVTALNFDASGARLLSSDQAGTTCLHDVATGALVHSFVAGEPCNLSSFDPHGTRVVMLYASGRAELCDAFSFAHSAWLDTNAAVLTSVSFSPDAAYVLSQAPGTDPVLFDARSGARVRSLACGGAAAACAFVPHSSPTRVLVASTDGDVALLDAADGGRVGTTVKIPGVHVPNVPNALVACADGRHAVVLANVDDEGWAFACDMESGCATRIEAHANHRVTQAAYSPDGKRFATTSFDTSICIFSTDSNRLLRRFRVPQRQLDAAWSADGERLLARTNTAFAHLWYTRSRPDLYDLEGHTGTIETVSFSPDGERALTASEDGTTRLWSTSTQKDAHDPGACIALIPCDGPLLSARFSPDGSTLITAAKHGEVGFFDARTATPSRAAIHHRADILEAVVDPRGERLVTLCVDGLARIWSTRADGDALLLEGSAEPLNSAAFSPEASLVAIGTRADIVRVHDVRDGRLLYTWPLSRDGKPAGGVDLLAFNPVSGELAIACADKKLRFLDPKHGTTTRSFADLTHDSNTVRDAWLTFACKSLTFSRDGAQILITSRFGGSGVRSKRLEPSSSLDVRTIESDAHTTPTSTHVGDLTSAGYDESGNVVLTTSQDGSAYVWSSIDGSPIARREGFASAVTCGALCSRGGTLRAITGCADGRVCVWPVDPLPAARARLPRTLATWEKERERQLALPLELEFD